MAARFSRASASAAPEDSTARDAPGPAARGGDGEAARVGEDVEHAPALGQRLDEIARVALVEVEARLLPRQHVHEVAPPTLPDRDRPARRVSPQRALSRREALAPRGRRVGALEADRCSARGLERAGHGLAARGHPGRGQLHDHHVGVAVRHEPRQAIRLGVHEPHRIGIPQQGIARASRQRRRNALLEPALGRRLLAEGQQPHPQRRVRREVPEAQHLPLGGEHAREGTGRRRFLAGLHARDRAGEHPGMAPAHRAIAAGLKDDVDHGACSGLAGGPAMVA